MLRYSDKDLFDLIHRFCEIGKPLAVHAIGDRAVRQTIRVVAAVTRTVQNRLPLRMEHCQLIDFESAKRAKDLGIVLSMQPNFSVDSVDYRDRLNDEQCLKNNPLRMLIDRAGFIPGEDLLFGSDGMPHGVEPALQMSLFPPVASQRLTMDEFVAGYCLPDTSKGSIEITIDPEQQTVRISGISISA
jgi:predicted amidohydrolase YtcJ